MRWSRRRAPDETVTPTTRPGATLCLASRSKDPDTKKEARVLRRNLKSAVRVRRGSVSLGRHPEGRFPAGDGVSLKNKQRLPPRFGC